MWNYFLEIMFLNNDFHYSTNISFLIQTIKLLYDIVIKKII